MSGNNNAQLEVPPQYRQHFTQDQMDELVSQFQMSDSDGSGSIDEQEFRQLLTRMSLVVSDAEAGDLVASIDTDGNGLIEFPELVSMVVRIKAGDERFSALKKFLETLDTTPISLLQREAVKFGLTITYQLLEERQGTSNTPPMFLMELQMSGKWCGPTGIEKMQSIGKTTREAKFKVAEAGLVRLKKLKPGLAYDLGVLPSDWEAWLFDNIERGGNPKKVIRTLRDKGFSPSNNNMLMQKISARISSRKLRSKRSGPRAVYESNGADEPQTPPRPTNRDRVSPHTPTKVSRRLDPQWVHWCQHELARGIDGRVVLEELIAQGYEPEKNPLYTQSLLRTHKNRDDKASNGPIATTATSFSFWHALEEGNLTDIELFVFGGQDVNASHEDVDTHLTVMPLHVVCKHGHLSVVKFLLAEGACVDALDSFHRSPLLIAARYGFSDICEQLLGQGASIFTLDNIKNTSLHMAAFSGSSAIASQLLRTHDDRFLNFVARLPQTIGQSYEMLLKSAYDFRMKQKLRDNERRRFHRSWLLETAQWVHSQLFGSLKGEPLTPVPQKFLMDYLVELYSNELTSSSNLSAEDDDDGSEDDDDSSDNNHKRQPDDPAVWLSLSHMTFYVDRCLRGMYKHLINKQGRTALHVACDENLVCTHERIIHLLAERHGCSPIIPDYSGSLPIDLVLACSGRPGSPRGDSNLEQRLLQDREDRARKREVQRETDRIAQRRKVWQDNVDEISKDYDDLDNLTKLRAAVKFEAEKSRNAAHKAALLSAETDNNSALIAGWNVYSEPQSRNRLFENAVSGFVQHQVPAKVVEEIRVRLGWKEKMESQARLVERNRFAPEWEIHRLNGTDIYFFFNRAAGTCQWTKPRIETNDKEKAEMARWKTKRVFESEEQLEDEPDREALEVKFSGTASTAIMQNAATRRELGEWRECLLRFGGPGGALFYVHSTTRQISIEKPGEVLRLERERYGHALIQQRSENIEQHSGGWERYFDPATRHTFYYDSVSGICVHDSYATREFLSSIRKVRFKRKVRGELSPLTDKELLQRRLEEKEWKKALERARKHDELVKQQQEEKEQQEQKAKEEDEELEGEIQHLEECVGREHLGGEAFLLHIQKPTDGGPRESIIVKVGAYVASRFARELEVFLAARRNNLLVSQPPPLGSLSARCSEDNEISHSMARERALDDLELANSEIEDVDSSIPIRERRRVSRVLVRAASRLPRTGPLDMTETVISTVTSEELCRWGCERWFPRRKQALQTHEIRECDRRLMVCRLGCGLVREARQWHSYSSPKATVFIYDHENERKREGEGNTCAFRITPCPRACGVWVPYDVLAPHMKDTCVRRPVGDLYCRLGCGEVFRDEDDGHKDHDHELLALEQERIAHEQDSCPLRLVECTWTSPPCGARILAKDRKAHRKAHVLSSGVVSFLAVGAVHEYKVPRGVRVLKIQAWGAGGGSGMLRGRAFGRGGGGAFVEGECNVHPGETLYILIGEGGSGGKSAQMVEVVEQVDLKNEGNSKPKLDVRMETVVGEAKGGVPGGGTGHAGNCETACGGGGGFTSIYRQGAYGIEYLMIAGGGGGGGTCRHGGGGAGLKLKVPLLKPGDDDRCGQPGGNETFQGGAAGICDPLNPICRFLATSGVSMQGGDGAEFGGGGGGGYFGGGGGGFAPGIVGGGGGGSSYVNLELFNAATVRVETGSASGEGKPGGMRENPPSSSEGEDDTGLVGAGGSGSLTVTSRGSHGGVRMGRPGFFNDMKDLR